MFCLFLGNWNFMVCEKVFLEEMLEYFKKNNCIVEVLNFFLKSSSKFKICVIWLKVI